MKKQKLIIITGASDGVGKSAVRLLHAEGHQVVIVGQCADKTLAVANELHVPYYVADFSDLAQVRQLAAELAAAYPQIDVLANNAGAIFGERKLTQDGFEITLQVNYLAPFLLTHLLLPTLLQSQAVMIQTASVSAEKFGHLDINDLQNAKKYDVNKAYGDSKLALILYTRELDRRYRAQGLRAVSFHPGNLATGFAKGSSSWFRFIYHTPLKLLMGKPEVGGKALQWLVDGVPGQTWQLGEYYEDNAPAKKVNPQSTDRQLAKQLWEQTTTLLHLA